MIDGSGRATPRLQGKRVAIVGSAHWPAQAVAAALDAAGSTVSELDDGPLDLVVHVAECHGAERSLVDLDEQAWERAAEAPARALLATMQRGFGALRQAGGRLIVVVPAVTLEGAAGLVAETTGWETVRVLAKSAARRWAEDGITVHTVAVRLDEPDDASRTDPVLGAEHLGGEAVADTVLLLATQEARHLTGTTVVADGGALMLP